MSQNQPISLLADIGGTNTRLACWCRGNDPRAIKQLRSYENARYQSLDALIGEYLASLPNDSRPAHGAFAIAAPIRGSTIRMMNFDWEFETNWLRDKLGFQTLDIINDFAAQAWALPTLRDDDRLAVGGGNALPGSALAVLGPGTGLGMAGLVPATSGYAVVTGEGGHMTLGAANDFEAEILAKVRSRIGHCSAERIISGSGLTLLHDVLHGASDVMPSVLSAQAKQGESAALQTFNVFFDFFGTVASDLALTIGALGGTYLAGGIALSNSKLLQASGFRQRFVDKGRYREYLEKIPTWIVTDETPALYGLAHFLSETH